MKKKKLLVEVKECVRCGLLTHWENDDDEYMCMECQYNLGKGFFARAQKEEIHTGHYMVALLVVCWIVSSLIVTFGSIYLDLRQ